jgi:sugar-specific transcriptional regulator TrmB
LEDSLRHLQKLGFTEYEARAYLALLRHNPSTRYQLSQNAAIPDSKIYEVVRRLQDKGMIAGLHGDPPRFMPLAPEQLLSQLEHKTQESLDFLSASLHSVANQPAVQWIWNIEGYDQTLSKAKDMIEAARDELTASMWHEEAERVLEPLKAAAGRGVTLNFLAYDACPIDFGNLREHVHRDRLQVRLTDAQGRWLTLVTDRAQVLVASSLESSASAVWTNHAGLAMIVNRYVMEHFYPE